VVDQLNIHQSEMLVKLVAKELGIELALDSKGNLKLMKAMASRRTFPADPAHRIRFVYTPKYASWLNQIELWYSILARRLLKRGSFTSVEDLHRRILEFVEYFNRTMAKPFKWTCIWAVHSRSDADGLFSPRCTSNRKRKILQVVLRGARKRCMLHS